MPRLITEEEKERLFFSYGIKTLFRVNFREIADLPPDVFVREILQDRLHVECAVVGEDFRYGRQASGDAETLAHAIQTVRIPPVTACGVTVSSTEIRRAVADGDMERATAMLSRPFTLSGEVAHGKSLGRNLGFPTLNLPLPRGMILPKCGVYASRVTLSGKAYAAVTNIGVRPSVERTDVPNIESHLIDASGDFYGETARVELLHFLRAEQKFPSIDALRRAIGEDTENLKKWMNRSTHN